MKLIPVTKTTFGKKLPNRVTMLKNLVSNLILHEQIITTSGKARAVRPIVELLVQNAKANRTDLKTEAQNWTVNHQRTMPLLYGPLRQRYATRDEGFTRSYSLLYRKYRHSAMSVVELVDGPKDTLRNLENYREDLAEFKLENGDLLGKSIDELVQGLDSTPHGRLHPFKRQNKENKEAVEHIMSEAGKEKCRYIMTTFAKHAVGEPVSDERKEFWVR